MQVKVTDISGILRLEAETSDEAELLRKLFEHGIRPVMHSSWTLSIADPRLAKLTALYLTDVELRMVHNALAQYAVKDRILGKLLESFYPERLNAGTGE